MVVESLVILIDLAFTILITLVIPTGKYYHYWAPFLLLIAGYILGVAIMWCVLSAFAAPYSKTKKYDKPSKWANFWLCDSITYIDRHAGARVKIINNIALPKERFLLICNHISKFDPMVIYQEFGKKRQIAFISKPTNFKIPIGGHFMKATCCMSIDRYDKLKSLEIMKEATDLIANDISSVGVFPEGTRSEDEKFHEFHEGVFSIAIKSKCPIVVTTVKNTIDIHKNFPKRCTKVYLEVVKVIYPEEYDGMIAKELSDRCHDLMEASINA